MCIDRHVEEWKKFPEIWYLKKAYLTAVQVNIIQWYSWLYYMRRNYTYCNTRSTINYDLKSYYLNSFKVIRTKHFHHFEKQSGYSFFLITCIIFHKLFWMNVDITLMCMYVLKKRWNLPQELMSWLKWHNSCHLGSRLMLNKTKSFTQCDYIPIL